jgi:hypothetical protein
MKQRFLFYSMSVLLTAVVAAQTPKYGATAEAEKNVDFTKFKTYSWTKGQPSFYNAIDAKIISSVDKELAALGMSQASSGPGDVVVTYSSLTRTDVNLKAKADPNGKQPQYSVGTLVVAFLDPGSRKRLLRLRIDKPIEAQAEKVEAVIDEAVAEMFSKYPTRTKK